jgi:hypothetical protein
MLAAAEQDTVLEIPPREEWPVPDLYSRPLSSHPVPFLVQAGGVLHSYPNPPRGTTHAEVDNGLQCPESISVRFERRGRSVDREVREGSPAPGPVSARLRGRLRSQSPAVAATPTVPASAPPVFRRARAPVQEASASTTVFNGPHPSTASSSTSAAPAMHPTRYWVVVRGVFPGLYDDKNHVKHAICRCDSPIVQGFRELGEASAFYDQMKAVKFAETVMCYCGM